MDNTKPITMEPVQSSQIAAIGHDPVNNTLAVRFSAKPGTLGSLYHYANVSADAYAAFKGADSLGKHFAEHIKNKTLRHPVTKMAAARKAVEGEGLL